MNKLKSLIRFLIVIFTFLTIQTQVLASSFELEAKAEKNTLKEGEEITINIGLVNIESNTGINAIQGNIEYDHEVIEFVRLEKLNNWTINYNDEKDGKFIAMVLSRGEKENQSIGKMIFRIKHNVKVNESSIKLKNIESSDESEKIKIKDKDIVIKIENRQDSENQKEINRSEINTIEKNDNNKYIIITIISLILVGIAVALLYVIIRLRRKKDEEY